MENHFEVSEGDTVIVTSTDCPLKDQYCCRKGQNLIHDVHELGIMICPYFYGATYSEKRGFMVACRCDK